jgi:hypothetical protein
LVLADPRQEMTLDEILWQAFRHFVHLDESNAAMHCAPVRYSPITFRLSEALIAHCTPLDNGVGDRDALVQRVSNDRGRYLEDAGR